MKLAPWTSAAMLALLPLASHAVEVTSHYTNLGGANWQVDLTLTNDNGSLLSAGNPTGSISEFTVFFPFAAYDNLASLAAPAGWDPLAIQGDASPSDGFVDYLINPGNDPLGLHQSVSGMSISFTYTGSGAPGSLRYDIVDPNTFETLFEGQTIDTVAAVPEPSTNALLLLGMGALAWRFASQKRRPPAPQATTSVEPA